MSTNNKQVFDLIVIGGGVSGLSTVLNLFKNHSNTHRSIALLEGRNRLGGRIFTSKTLFEEEKIEIGANWIHGIIDNPIYNILYKKQILDPVMQNKKSSYNIEAKTVDGKDVNTYWIRKVYDAYSNMIKRSTLFYQANKDDVVVDKFCDSLGKFLQNEIDKWIEQNVKDEAIIDLAKGLFDSLIKRETCISGTDSIDDVSLQYFGAYEEYLGGNLTISKGYYSLIQALLDDIEELTNGGSNKFQYYLESKVTKINWLGLDKTNDTKSNTAKSPIEIVCSNGNRFYCNHVIITIPLGCLKKSAKQLFEPSLPEYKLQCIDRMGFDTVDKIFLEYSSKSVLTSIFTHEGVITDEMMLLWEDSKCCQDQAWYTKIYSIYRITDHCIQLWVSGREAIVLENLTADQINTDLTKQLKLFFKDANFPRADNVIVTRWGTDEFCLGSYSYIRKGSSPQDIKHLSMPIYRHQNDHKPIIAFAGEATHENYFSTVHGAYLSGQNVAKYFDCPNHL